MKSFDNAQKTEVKNAILKLHSRSPEKYKIKYYKKILKLINKASKLFNCDKDKMQSYLLERLGEPCIYCGEIITAKNISVDHIIPLKRGAASYFSNLNVVCNTCNKRKGKLTHDEYVEILILLARFEYKARKYVLSQLSRHAYYSS